ncbi:MAG: zinc dependent phospholipase C family protein [Acidobacteria bacterium]|nr:zinc dependent phospholipase C family protein [Acidobacteriota bacterium]
MKAVCLMLGLILCFSPQGLQAYSVLTHEQVVDLAWEDRIQPMLLKRFPETTPDGLRHAHAFAYGGSLVQDMGYYPFGNKFFSDLLHYVRSGDMVVNLLKEATDVNEYAFALGALAHYSSDNMGHPTINQVVAIEFPKLRARFGNEVTYADDHKAHIRTEFGFDMVQVAKNRYTSDRYHDFIGFEIAKAPLERAFLKTYALELKDVLGDEDMAIGSFRRAVSTFIPAMTRVALLNRRADLVKDAPNPSTRKFLYQISRSNYEKEWGKGYRRPGIGSRILAFLLRKIPKVGPATALDFKVPSTRTEDMYVKSVDRTMDNYHSLLAQAEHADLKLPNTDCDTGRFAAAAEYSLADQTFARLLDQLDKKKFAQLTPELRTSILSFYSPSNPQVKTKKEQKAWISTQRELEELKNWAAPEPASNPAN